MLKFIFLVCISVLFYSCKGTKEITSNNKLSGQEKKEDWKLLFDGKTTKGWHRYNHGAIDSVWKVKDGMLCLETMLKKQYDIKGDWDIVTDEEYENYELQLEWKINQNGNSGIFINVHEDKTRLWPWESGPEMQILDNNGHVDGLTLKHRAGDMYDLISCSPETVKPYDEWNLVEIKCINGRLDFYLNGINVVSITMWDDNWKKMIADSKFAHMEGFGTYKKGRIGLQDHGDVVCFRNIKVRRLY